MNRASERTPVLAVGLLSAASLGFEILLLRWFAILYWHHFAHMIISVALLGLGIAGSILTISQRALIPRFKLVFMSVATAFALSLPLVVLVVGRIGFNPLEVIWDAGQGWRLALVFLVSSVPFIFSGFGIGLSLRRFPDQIAVLYRADLAGAALGALGVPILLTAVLPQTALRWLVAPALIAAFSAAGGLKSLMQLRRRSGLSQAVSLIPVIAGLLIALWPATLLKPAMSPYKALPQALRMPGMRVVAQEVSPAGIALALASEQVPFRLAPGLSMLAAAEPPAQTALFIDGHSAGSIDHAVAGDRPENAAAYMDWTTAALPYALIPAAPHVLALGAGGGNDVRHAQRAGAALIDAVESSGALLAVVQQALDRVEEGEGYDHGDTGPAVVRWVAMEPRSFLAATRETYDLIQISPFGTAAPGADAAQAMREQYLYTVEGMRLMLRRLSDHGVLAITAPVEIPPRAPVKLLATMAAVAKEEGLGEPGAHLAVVRSWNTVTLVIGRRALNAAQIEAVDEFCRQRVFDPVWYPGLSPDRVNRANMLDHPYYYEAAREILLGRGDDYLRHYPFYVQPATDDKPYFGRFFRWRSFPEWWAGRAAGTAPFLEWSYLLAWMLVAAALILAVPLVGLPLRPLIRRIESSRDEVGHNVAPTIYFAALGLAFLFLEIVFIQKFVLFLGHPVVSMAVVVPAFLAFAGLGSGWSNRFAQWRDNVAARRWFPHTVMLAVICMAVVSGLYAVVLPALFQAAAGWPIHARIVISIALIGGLAVWMGIPFPLGLKRLGESRPEWIPLAWGINGLASVVSAVGTGLLAIHAGFRMVTLAALLLYILAASLEKRL